MAFRQILLGDEHIGIDADLRIRQVDQRPPFDVDLESATTDTAS